MLVIPWDGSPIATPGVYSGIPLETYHGPEICAGRSVSSSVIRTAFLESAAHAWNGSPYNPDAEPFEQSEPMLVGSAAHHLLLGEADFKRSYVVRPETYPGAKGDAKWTMAAAYCKDWVATQEAAGLAVLSEGQIERVRGMAASLAQDPLVKAGALSGLIEHSFFWVDAETGLWLKWRPDALPEGSRDVSDLKCVAGVQYDDIERSIADRGYNCQGALGRWAFREVLGGEMESFSLVNVESRRPHCVATLQITDDALDLGERQLRAGLRLIKRGFDEGVWPGPGGRVSDARPVGLTTWAKTRIETRLALIEQELAQ